jgi:hypothetical protein
VVRSALQDGPHTRPQLRELLVEAGVPVDGQALVHVLMRTCLLGHAVRGPVIGGENAYAPTREWLGPGALDAPTDRDVALGELARRYLAGHGPAGDRDLARWAGISLGDARRGLSGVRGLKERGGGLVSLRRSTVAELPPPRLLGPFEPLLLGWADRETVVGEHRELVTTNGIFRPFVLVDGRAAGTWSTAAGGPAVQPFQPWDDEVASAVEAEAADVRRFLGTSRYR